MRKAVFNDGDLRKVFFFPDNDRSMFENLESGSIVELAVKDAAGEVVVIPFSVTRNTFLGSYRHWVYGEVLEPEDHQYRQIEIRLHKDTPEDDTIGVFLQAPPLKF